jgi:hypothetical protein
MRLARNLPRLALATFLSTTLIAAVALGRDERRGERMRGDDDPIIVPRSVAAERGAIESFDPETTGSIGKVPIRTARDCNRLGFYRENRPEMQFQEAC